MAVSEALARCPLFALLNPHDLQDVAAISRMRSVAKGELIFREHDPCEGVWVVASGAVRIYTLAPDGRERTLHIMRPPHSFAEAALFTGSGYPAFAEATETARVVVVHRDPFLRLLSDREGLAGAMFQSLSQWTHRLLDQLEAETFLNARARVATWLLRELKRQGDNEGRVKLLQSRKDIALQLGMAPETWSRIQGEFEAHGLIHAKPHSVDILDRDGLHGVVIESKA